MKSRGLIHHLLYLSFGIPPYAVDFIVFISHIDAHIFVPFSHLFYTVAARRSSLSLEPRAGTGDGY